MAFKNIIHAIAGKKTEPDTGLQTSGEKALIMSDLFPVVRAKDVDLKLYREIPFTGIAALGNAFRDMSTSARSIVQTVTENVATKEKLYVGLNPKNVVGVLVENAHGTVGNIMNYNEQGKYAIAGRMRFKAWEGGLPVQKTTLTTVPFNPMTMVVAAALIRVERKLANLQKSVDEILQFLKLDKQSKQRGNLNMLAEILEEYKQKPDNEELRKLRNVEVQTVKREAHQDILFYQEQIARKLKEQSLIHISQKAQAMQDAVMNEFYEYQLACYLYAFSSFLDVLLQQDFDSSTLATTTKRLGTIAGRYAELYQNCKGQIANYQQTAIDTKIISGLGSFTANLGNLASSVPVLKNIQADEALKTAGESLSEQGEKALQKKLDRFSLIEDSRIQPFIENVNTMDVLYNQPNSMLLDGKHLYILEPASSGTTIE